MLLHLNSGVVNNGVVNNGVVNNGVVAGQPTVYGVGVAGGPLEEGVPVLVDDVGSEEEDVPGSRLYDEVD